MPYSPVSDILDDLRAGKMVILQDDPHRENEGDLVIAAEKVTPEAVHFFLKEARGKTCLAMTEERADELQLPPQVTRNTSFHTTAFAVSLTTLMSCPRPVSVDVTSALPFPTSRVPCSIDVIASVLPYDRYVAAETFLSLSQLPGEFGVMFRSPEQAKTATNDLRRAQAEAEVRCF